MSDTVTETEADPIMERYALVEKTIDQALAKPTTLTDATNVLEAISWLREHSTSSETLLTAAKLTECETRALSVRDSFTSLRAELKEALTLWRVKPDVPGLKQIAGNRLRAVLALSPKYPLNALGIRAGEATQLR